MSYRAREPLYQSSRTKFFYIQTNQTSQLHASVPVFKAPASSSCATKATAEPWIVEQLGASSCAQLKATGERGTAVLPPDPEWDPTISRRDLSTLDRAASEIPKALTTFSVCQRTHPTVSKTCLALYLACPGQFYGRHAFSGFGAAHPDISNKEPTSLVRGGFFFRPVHIQAFFQDLST